MCSACCSVTRLSVLVAGSGLHEFADTCIPLGRWIAERGFNLLTGGGQGVMRSVAQGFCSVPHEGVSIGILAGRYENGVYMPSEPNEFVEIPIFTQLWGSRGDT